MVSAPARAAARRNDLNRAAESRVSKLPMESLAGGLPEKGTTVKCLLNSATIGPQETSRLTGSAGLCCAASIESGALGPRPVGCLLQRRSDRARPPISRTRLTHRDKQRQDRNIRPAGNDWPGRVRDSQS